MPVATRPTPPLRPEDRRDLGLVLVSDLIPDPAESWFRIDAALVGLYERLSWRDARLLFRSVQEAAVIPLPGDDPPWLHFVVEELASVAPLQQRPELFLPQIGLLPRFSITEWDRKVMPFPMFVLQGVRFVVLIGEPAVVEEQAWLWPALEDQLVVRIDPLSGLVSKVSIAHEQYEGVQ